MVVVVLVMVVAKAWLLVVEFLVVVNPLLFNLQIYDIKC